MAHLAVSLCCGSGGRFSFLRSADGVDNGAIKEPATAAWLMSPPDPRSTAWELSQTRGGLGSARSRSRLDRREEGLPRCEGASDGCVTGTRAHEREKPRSICTQTAARGCCLEVGRMDRRRADYDDERPPQMGRRLLYLSWPGPKPTSGSNLLLI